MQYVISRLVGCTIRASDGDLGKVDEFYFDDETWTIRYIVAETGSWFVGRKVLISPVAFGKPELESRTIPVNLTRSQVRDSPDIDTEKPVYRQHEAQLHEYYQWPWRGGYGGTFGTTPLPLSDDEALAEQEASAPESRDDTHLRSSRQVTGYHIHAADGEIGHVEDFMVDDENWTIRFLVVDTANWLPGKKVLLSPQWIKRVEWADSSVHFNLTRESVKNSREFDPS
ncbi:PRC-barrel domain-containing protein [Desulfococcus sp.]|uniref:PRC-barrel domain-containing protein n=1 Tax=Desulfococcus sp. TaxID=2025834 RepID=UPI0035934405